MGHETSLHTLHPRDADADLNGKKACRKCQMRMGFNFLKRKGQQEPEKEDVEITASRLKSKMDKKEGFVLVDVRDHFEYEICKISGSIEIPLRELAARAGELDKSKEIVLYCHTGGRSMEALWYLKSSGFKNVKHIKGGIAAWADEIEPEMQRY